MPELSQARILPSTPEANVSHVQLQHQTCHAHGSDDDAKKAYDKCHMQCKFQPMGTTEMLLM